MNDLSSYISRIKDRYEGKKIWICDNSGVNGKRINIDYGKISLCHDMSIENIYPEIHCLSKIDSFDSRKYYERLYEIIDHFQSRDNPCRNCPHCKERVYSFEPVEYVTINTTRMCNSRCIYCSNHSDNELSYDPQKIIRDFHENELFSRKVWFDWGGGEPTKNQYFEKTVSMILQMGYFQRINTNAIDISAETINALKAEKASVRISVDSGTQDGFYRMKGTNNYDRVWKHIHDYSRTSKEVYIKYNVCNYNSSQEEIDSFLENCKEAEIVHLLLDAEVRSYQTRNNYGPFYFRKKEYDACRYLYKRAKDLDFDIKLSTYAFSYRSEYDDNGRLQLPEKYQDNTDYTVISNGVYVEAFATVKQLMEALDFRVPIVIYGAGKYGKLVEKILDRKGLSFVVVDGDTQKHGKEVGRHIIVPPSQVIKCGKKLQIIMAAYHFRDMLKLVNESHADARVFWVSGGSYENELCSGYDMNTMRG